MTKTEEDDVERWRRAYSIVAAIESNWTAQVQNQQARIATILAASGFLFGILAAFGPASLGSVDSDLLAASLVVLAMSMVCAIGALLPRTHIAAPPAKMPESRWLDAEWVVESMSSCSELTTLRLLCESIVQNQETAKHSRRLTERRWWMYGQLGFLSASLMLLSIAVVRSL